MNPPLKAESDVLEASCSKLLTAALNAGAQSAEVCGSFSQKTRIGLEKQDFHLGSSDSGFHLGIRVLKDGRQGFASTNSTDARDLKQMAARAVEIAGFSPENNNYKIVASNNVSSSKRYSLWDDGLFQVSLKTQQDWTKLLAEESMRDPRFRLNEGSVEVGASLFLIQNSVGTLKLERETHTSWSLMGMAVEGEQITSFDYFSALSRKMPGIPDRIHTSVHDFCHRVIATLRQAPAKTYEGAVVFSPRAVAEIFLDGLCYHLNGRNLADGLSRWTQSDLGRKTLDGRISLKDAPWEPERWGTAFFDREGIPTCERTLIENGELKGFFLDSYAATATGMQSTGNAIGGPNSVPAVGPHSVVLEAGDTALTAMYESAAKRHSEFLVVHRFSGQVDPVTGDFSGVAKAAEWWRGGERVCFTTETLVSGNLFNCLGSSLIAVSNQTEVVDCGAASPYLLCDGVSVTSGKS
jgi:PmbA protein